MLIMYSLFYVVVVIICLCQYFMFMPFWSFLRVRWCTCGSCVDSQDVFIPVDTDLRI